MAAIMKVVNIAYYMNIKISSLKHNKNYQQERTK